MSRSYRKTPIVGMTTAESDKEFKRQCHKAARQAEREALAHVDMDTEHVEIERPDMGGYGEKDGKQWLGDRFPEEMRK